ncbi:MAG: ATP-binding protein [Prevotella sp.]|nr:ATP-binding protein [Prevotella sp.]
MDNPFGFARSVVTGSNFVGRRKLCSDLALHLKGNGVVHVVGLPRIGKTSLVTHCFMEDEAWQRWCTADGVLPLKVGVDQCKDGEEFWGSVAMEMGNALTRMGSTEAAAIGDQCYNVITIAGEGNRYLLVQRFAVSVRQRLHKTFLFILDELDYLSDPHYGYTKDQLGKVSGLSQLGLLVTCSRRTPEQVEKRKFGTCYFGNKGKKLFVAPFTEDDVAEYWQHFRQPFAQLRDDQFLKYRELVSDYTGHHPLLMSLMNYFAIEAGRLSAWSAATTRAGREEVERSIRTELKTAFDEQMHYVAEQGLEMAAEKLVVGGMVAPAAEDIDILQSYGFIKMVPTAEKRRMFGYDLGPTTADGQGCYVCLSEFASHLMREEYRPLIKGIELLEKTEKQLRSLVRLRLKTLYGDDCLNVLSEGDEPADYAEKWEAAFLGLHGDDRLRDSLLSIKKVRYNRSRNDCKPPSERQPIDLVSSTSLGELWFIFMKNEWTFYSKVLDAAKWATLPGHTAPCYLGKAQRWYGSRFLLALNLRNAHQHFNDEELTDEFVQKAEAVCRQICADIEAWMGQNKR